MKHETFADLGVSEVVVNELAQREIKEPFAVQGMVIPDILAGHDVLAKSPTGSGRIRAKVVSYTTHMSKRLQVVLADTDLERYERSARAAGLTLSAWARQALNVAERETSSGDVEAKLAAVRKAVARDSVPAVDIDTMNAEIMRGYRQDLPGLNR
jgi:superfamily II DNA/RNA helicase